MLSALSSWTWVGMIAAWVVAPNGSAKDSIGGAMVGLLIIWLMAKLFRKEHA